MTSELIRILNRCRAGEPAAATELQLKLEPLLLEILGMFRRAARTPLQFGIDRHSIGRTVLNGLSLPSEQGAHLGMIVSTLDSLVRRRLETQKHLTAEDGPAVAVTGFPDAEPGDSSSRTVSSTGGTSALQDWLEVLEQAVCQTHPSAIDIAALRVEGFPDRDIAARLQLGLRLEQRIVSDMNGRLHGSGPKESPDAC